MAVANIATRQLTATARFDLERVLARSFELYEHSVFTKATIWDLDSFDQWNAGIGQGIACHQKLFFSR
jgi:glucose-6-phosphate isomerase